MAQAYLSLATDTVPNDIANAFCGLAYKIAKIR